MQTPVGASSGRAVFTGREAILAGSGYVAAGVMLVVWGIALLIAYLPQKVDPLRLGLASFLSWLSWACLLVSIGCTFPVWRWSSMPFFLVLALVAGTMLLARYAGHGRWVGQIFAAGGCAIMLAVFLGDDSVATNVSLGLFATLFILVHLFLLFPKTMKRLLPEPKYGSVSDATGSLGRD